MIYDIDLFVFQLFVFVFLKSSDEISLIEGGTRGER